LVGGGAAQGDADQGLRGIQHLEDRQHLFGLTARSFGREQGNPGARQPSHRRHELDDRLMWDSDRIVADSPF
jgi:hypothetical protein